MVYANHALATMSTTCTIVSTLPVLPRLRYPIVEMRGYTLAVETPFVKMANVRVFRPISEARERDDAPGGRLRRLCGHATAGLRPPTALERGVWLAAAGRRRGVGVGRRWRLV